MEPWINWFELYYSTFRENNWKTIKTSWADRMDSEEESKTAFDYVSNFKELLDLSDPALFPYIAQSSSIDYYCTVCKLDRKS